MRGPSSAPPLPCPATPTDRTPAPAKTDRKNASQQLDALLIIAGCAPAVPVLACCSPCRTEPDRARAPCQTEPAAATLTRPFRGDSPRRVRAGNPVTARPGPSHSRAPPALTCPSADPTTPPTRRRRRPDDAGGRLVPASRAQTKYLSFLSGMLSCRGSYHGGHGPHTRAAGQNKPPPPNALCPLPFCYTAREALMRCKAVFLANDKGSLDTLKTNSLYKMQAGSFETLSPLSGSWTGWALIGQANVRPGAAHMMYNLRILTYQAGLEVKLAAKSVIPI